jgi:predicted nucleotidyltransferase
MIHQFVEKNRKQINRLCEKYHVSRLDLFGSATGDSFDPAASDLDFVVTFEDLPLGQRADAYFGLLEELQKVLGRPVDLIMESAVENPYFAEELERSKEQLYAA